MNRRAYPQRSIGIFFTFWLLPLVAYGGLQERIIAFTFDDGPRPQILQELLPLLRKHQVTATFFVIGAVAVSNRALLQEMVKQGHEIENHTHGHENLKKLLEARGKEAVRSNIIKTGEIIRHTTGQNSRFFRPPFWVTTDEIEAIIAVLGYKVMKLQDPDINTLDYEDVAKKRPVEMLIARVQKLIARREREEKFSHVLVFHEHFLTVRALEVLIPHFQQRRYRFLRLDELNVFKRKRTE